MEMEVELLLDAIHQRYGYDFRDYSRAHVIRRLNNRLKASGLDSISMIQHKALHDEEFAAVLLQDLSINVTEMFRDPDFYKAIRTKIIDLLKTWSFIRIWHAGCSTGEEVYSMAIILKEEGLLDRCQIYATDFNEIALNKARQGIFSIEDMKLYAANYQRTGASKDFSDYYLAEYDSAIVDNTLKKNIVWANHNLVTDSDFAETHMIVCRNVLIYFNNDLQDRVHKLFLNSLVNGGFLCLGSKESMHTCMYKNLYDVIDSKQKIYKKKYI